MYHAMQWYVVCQSRKAPYLRQIVCTIEAAVLCTLHCTLLLYRILCSEGSSFGLEIRCSYIVASDIASVASRIIMQTLRRRGSFIRRSVGRLHIGPKCPNLFKTYAFFNMLIFVHYEARKKNSVEQQSESAAYTRCFFRLKLYC